MDSLRPELSKIIKQSDLIVDGNPTRYHLKPKTLPPNKSQLYIKIMFGERNKTKPHRVILMVGETGTGKTTLLNTIVNYMLNVQRKDKVWFEITDDQSDRSSAHSQTSKITVYGFYLQESKNDITIIDTPGYGDTRGVDLDKQIAESLLNLSQSEEGIHEIHAVCLVIKATQNRLSDRQTYIFDAVQSLFGRDVAANIVLLFTHSDGKRPKNALKAVEEAKIKCAVSDKNQPVFFLFNNCQADTADEDEDEEEYEMIQEQSWNRSFKGMGRFFEFLGVIQPKSLKMTQDVLQKRQQLEANINNLQARVQMTELKQNQLIQTKKALELNTQNVEKNKNFEYEVEVPYKKKIDIDLSLAYEAVLCTICEENCHYPGCWWITTVPWCYVMKDEHCTVCTKKCHHSKHVKEAKIYKTYTRIEKRMYEDLKREYDGKIGDGMSLVKKLEEELQELEKEKINLINEAFECVETLEKIALNTNSLLTLQHIDFLIEKLVERNEPEKSKTLENIKKRAEKGKKGALGYLTSFFKK